MTDLLLTIGFSNLCVSAALALLAWAVQATGKRPLIAHLLWLLVVAKLVTPPILTVPMVAVPGLTAAGTASAVDSPAPEVATGAAPGILDSRTTEATAASWTEHGRTWLALLWLAGSAGFLGWSLLRVYRFNRLLGIVSEEAPPGMQRAAAEIAERLGLPRVPTILTTAAHVSPMVWWVGRRVRVIVPNALPGTMDAGQIRWILAHELAHVRRRDHLVRWLEWLACVVFWWNPVAWLARRNLRANEEICCDALVLERLAPDPHTYANALMTVVEFLAVPATRPPAMASEILSGGVLERRFKMIVSSRSLRQTPRWVLALMLLCAVGLLPLGVAYAQDFDAVGKRLRAAVAAGELTPGQAKTMMLALKKKAGGDARAVGMRLREAVAAGELSAERAEAMMGVPQKPGRGQKDVKDEMIAAHVRDYLAKLRTELGIAVRAGKMSREDAGRKYQAAEKTIKEKLAAGRHQEKKAAAKKEMIAAHVRDYLAKLRTELGIAVRAGKMSREDAGKKYQAAEKIIKEKLAAGRHHEKKAAAKKPQGQKRVRAYLMKVKKKLGAALEKGEISEEEARKKYEAVEKAVGERMDAARRARRDSHHERRGL